MYNVRKFAISFSVLIASLHAAGILKYHHSINQTSQNVSDTAELNKPDYIKNPLAQWEQKFVSYQFKVSKLGGHILPYRYYIPDALKSNEKLPLVIFMHGAGERGFDNRKQFFRFNPEMFWQKYRCIVLAPQCDLSDKGGKTGAWVDTPYGDRSHHMKEEPTWELDMVIKLIRQKLKNNNVDPKRIYLTGLSMGGFATWELLERNAIPIAAAIPISGGGDTSQIKRIRPIPIWAFHGDADKIVPVECSRDMVQVLRQRGMQVKYDEYPGVGHDAWSITYQRKEVWDWLFLQRLQDK